MRNLRTAALITGLGLAGLGAEAREMREETVHFNDGQTTVEMLDRIYGREAVTYRVHVREGETLEVLLKPSNLGTYFNVYEPGTGPGDIAIGSSDRLGETVPELNRFASRAHKTGTYLVSVYLIRAAARAGEMSNYALEITAGDIQMKTAAESTSKEIASTSSMPVRGPEFYVADVESRLRVHAAPTIESDVVLHAYRGTVFRNLGCVQETDRVWCQVERTSDGLTGWAAQAFLRGEGGAFTTMVGEEETPFAQTHGWNILVRAATDNGCIAERTHDGVQIQIGMDPADQSSFLAIYTEKHLGLANGEHLGVRFELDGDTFVGDVTEEKRAGFEGGYVHVNNPAFLMDLSDKETLTVYPAGVPPFTVDLDGSKAAIGKMIECQLAQ